MRHGKLLYRALGIHNVAIPGDSHHGRFFVSISTHRKAPQVYLQLARLLLNFTVVKIYKYARSLKFVPSGSTLDRRGGGGVVVIISGFYSVNKKTLWDDSSLLHGFPSPSKQVVDGHLIAASKESI